MTSRRTTRLRGLRVLHLVAHRDLEALAQQTLQVAAGGVVRHAAHGHGLRFVARGERQLQLARGDDGVLVEELVEVAHAEEEQGVGMSFLGRAKYWRMAGVASAMRCERSLLSGASLVMSFADSIVCRKAQDIVSAPLHNSVENRQTRLRRTLEE